MGLSTYDYLNPVLNINGRLSPRHQYSTDLLADQSTMLLDRQAHAGNPWFMWVNYIAPHHGEPGDSDDGDLLAAGIPTPYVAPRYRGAMAGIRSPASPNLFRGNAHGTHLARPGSRSPPVSGRRCARGSGSGWSRCSPSTTPWPAPSRRCVATTSSTRRSSSSTSDNGFMTGQHNVYGKLLHYDESLRIPVTMRGPGIPVGEVVETAITNPDLATTIAAIAGARPGRHQDGIDIRPLLHTGPRLRIVPIEAYPVHGGFRPVYTGIRYGPYTYVRLLGGAEELFDQSATRTS